MISRNFSRFAVLVFVCNTLANTIPVWERLTPTRRHARGRRLLAPDDQCASELWSLEHQLTQVVHPVDLQGHWVSSECEIHAGPKYVLRDYQFYKTGNFLIRHYEYKDDSCATPVYGFTANGNILHLSKSWAVPGGTDSTFALNQVTVVPYTKSAAKSLALSLRRQCRLESGKAFDWPWLEEYRDYVIFNSRNEDADVDPEKSIVADSDNPTIDGSKRSTTDDPENSKSNDLNNFVSDSGTAAEFDCLQSANFTMVQLGLLRMDETMDSVRRSQRSDEFLIRQLYFGKPVWDARNGTFMRPSGFQNPLVDVDQTTNCKTCQRIKGSNPLSPPRLKIDLDKSDCNFAALSALSPAIDFLDGDWISTQCESYEHGMYAHRRMSFSTASRVWHLRQRYYNDPLCKHASFTLLADGHFSVLGNDDFSNSDALAGTQRVSYRIEKIQLVPESRATVHNLRRAQNCGPGHKWRQGRTLDISPYGGCAPLGIFVPAVTKDVVKVVADVDGESDRENKRLLFTGDYSAVEHSGKHFPTSFQSPLVKCAEMTVVVSLDTSKSDRSPDERYGINFSRWQTNASAAFTAAAYLIFMTLIFSNFCNFI